MFFKKYKELKEENDRQQEYIYKLSDNNDKLKNENEKLKEDFIKNFDYVLTFNRGYYTTHLYRNGKEIKNIKKLDFHATLHETPYFEIELD